MLHKNELLLATGVRQHTRSERAFVYLRSVIYFLIIIKIMLAS
jgi:hypothetical protein